MVLRRPHLLARQSPGAAFHHAGIVHDREYGADNDLNIKPEANIPHIFAVKTGLGPIVDGIPPVDLGPAAQSWQDVIGSEFVPFPQQVKLVPQRGTGADDAHLSSYDVDQLGQFVEAGFP